MRTMSDTLGTAVVVEVDQTAGAAYVRFNENAVASTVQHGDAINLDMDQYGMVVGIEVMDLAADIPFQALVTDYHVESSKVELLRLLRPSISGFITLSGQAHAEAAPATHASMVDC